MDVEEKNEIILDKETLKIVIDATRIRIIKLLSEKQQTLTELAQVLNLSMPTVKEHLEKLERTQIIKHDEGRKWKYYSLTRKGEAIIHQERFRIRLIIGSFIIGIIGVLSGIVNLLPQVQYKSMELSKMYVFKQQVQTSTFSTITLFLLGIIFIILGSILLILRRRPK